MAAVLPVLHREQKLLLCAMAELKGWQIGHTKKDRAVHAQTYKRWLEWLEYNLLQRCSGLLAPLAAGASVIIPNGGKFSAGVFWKDAVEYKATFYTAVPTMHQVIFPALL